jgi:hypothetical protein
VHSIKYGKKEIDIYNDVERVYSETRIDHNMIASDVFFNIGGIETLFPLLYNIAEQEHSKDFMYLLLTLVATSPLKCLLTY